MCKHYARCIQMKCDCGRCSFLVTIQLSRSIKRSDTCTPHPAFNIYIGQLNITKHDIRSARCISPQPFPPANRTTLSMFTVGIGKTARQVAIRSHMVLNDIGNVDRMSVARPNHKFKCRYDDTTRIFFLILFICHRNEFA